MTKPETWTRYPRSLDAEKDRAALVARLQIMKMLVRSAAYDLDGRENRVLLTRMFELCTILDQEHADWIAQRGIESVREAVLWS